MSHVCVMIHAGVMTSVDVMIHAGVITYAGFIFVS
jgi:hypothetical protein